MSIGRWMDKKSAVHIHNGILLSYNGILLNHKKERIWVASNEVDEPGAYHTEWSKSERERQMLFLTYIYGNLERWYQWYYIQGSKGDMNVKNRLLDSLGEAESGMIWQNTTETCTLPYIRQMTNASSVHEAGHPKLVLWDNPERWGGEGGGSGVRIEGTHVYL